MYNKTLRREICNMRDLKMQSPLYEGLKGEQLEKERQRERQRERESNIMKFIKNKWYVCNFLIEF